jgi:RNA polymerase sigma-70 factor (family 1)
MDYQLLDDIKLVALLNVSDEKAFQEIYKRYWKPLYFSVLKKIERTDVAEELLQNLFVSLWNNRGKVQIESLGPYLATSARYQVISYIRSVLVRRSYQQQELEERHSEEASVSDSDHLIRIQELKTAIQNALEKMPEKTRTIFQMSRYEQLPVKEIARQMELSEKSVEYHITQSLKILRSFLKEYLPVSIVLYPLFLN